jgi:endonuclease/exonuclease/phosphatase family metal-dependent hydrolase
MKILTWNAWYKEDPKNILELLQNTEWDVCCLQEITLGFHSDTHSDVASYLTESLGIEGHFVVAQSWNENERSQGNLILSKLPVKDTFSYFIQDYNDDPEPSFSDEGRVVVGIELENSIKILTTHMSYTPEFTETEKKNIESKKLLEYLTSISSPFVIAGDLNAVPASDLVTELSGRYRNLSPDLTEPTWTTKPFSHEGFEVDTLSHRLDYVFSSREVNLIDSEIIQTEYSDHLPILCEVELSKG